MSVEVDPAAVSRVTARASAAVSAPRMGVRGCTTRSARIDAGVADPGDFVVGLQRRDQRPEGVAAQDLHHRRGAAGEQRVPGFAGPAGWRMVVVKRLIGP